MRAIGLLASLCQRRGRLDEAARHAEWLLRLKKRTIGEEDLATADTMLLLGQVCRFDTFAQRKLEMHLDTT